MHARLRDFLVSFLIRIENEICVGGEGRLQRGFVVNFDQELEDKCIGGRGRLQRYFLFI